jgi:RNA polymerase sigma-70 factor (ECF subfamily)
MRGVVEAYLDAWSRADVDALRALLAEDAVFSMPPWAHWWRGADTIAGFTKTAMEVCKDTRWITTHARAQIAVASYGLDDATGRYTPTAIDVYTVGDRVIEEITAFVMPELFPRFGLPAELGPWTS